MPQTSAILQQVVDVGVRLVEARYGAIGVLTELGDAFAEFLTVGIGFEARLAIGPAPLGLGLLGEVLRDPRPLRVPIIWQDTRSAGFPRHHPRIQSFLGIPLRSARKVRGGLYFGDKEGFPEFRAQDERMAECLGRLAVDALEGEANHPGVRRSLRHLQEAVGEKGEAVIIMSPAREIIRWSEGASALFGFSAEEALGRGFVDLLVPPEDRERWRRQFEPGLMRDLHDGKAFRHVAPRLHKDGRQIPVSITLNPVRHVVSGIETITGVYKFGKN